MCVYASILAGSSALYIFMLYKIEVKITGNINGNMLLIFDIYADLYVNLYFLYQMLNILNTAPR